MRIRTLSSMAVLFVGLGVLGCQAGDDTGAVDETTEEPVMQEETDDGMMDETMEDTATTDTAAADTAMGEMGEADEGEADEGEVVAE